jgi:hypothetical protein
MSARKRHIQFPADISKSILTFPGFVETGSSSLAICLCGGEIGHLSGAKDQQDRGLGAVLLADALWRAIESTVGSSMVIVEALDENTAGSVPRTVSSACPTPFGRCC